MKWKLRKDKGVPPEASPTYDAEVARLTARADLIVEELDVVVQELSDMLRNAYRTGQ